MTKAPRELKEISLAKAKLEKTTIVIEGIVISFQPNVMKRWLVLIKEHLSQ